MGRWRLRLVIAVVVQASIAGLHPICARAAEPAPVRCSGPAERDVVSGAEAGGELRLRSGRLLRLADVRLAEPGAPAGAQTWLASLAGSDLLVTPLARPDRWGLVPALAALPSTGPGAPVDVAEMLVGEGWARVDVGERDELCRPDLLRLEQAARARGLGLWASGPDPFRADDPGRLREFAGRFVLVEGRIVSVGERAARTYLNFGRDFGRDFAVVIPRRSWASLKAAGLTAERLRGRTVRVRGILDVGRAPSMELLAADMLEFVPDGAARRP